MSNVVNQFTRYNYDLIQQFYQITSPKSIKNGKVTFELENDLTVKSAVLSIKSKGRFDDNERFGSGLEVTFRIDQPRIEEIPSSDIMNQLCLGTVSHDSQWSCYSRKESRKSREFSLMISNLTFEIDRPGIYAVILRPEPKKPNLGAYPWVNNGLIKRKMSELLVICFLFFPILLVFISIVWNLIAFAHSEKNIKIDRDNMQERLKRVENMTIDFVGQKLNEKVDIGINYYMNPMHQSKQINIDETKKLNTDLEILDEEEENMTNKRDKLRRKALAHKKDIQKYRRILRDFKYKEKEDVDNFDEKIVVELNAGEDTIVNEQGDTNTDQHNINDALYWALINPIV